MAIVIRNTFLDVAEHKFLHFDEPCVSDRRSSSVPRTFKPDVTPKVKDRTASPGCSTRASRSEALSDYAFFSPAASFDELSASEQTDASTVSFSDLCANSSDGSCEYDGSDADDAATSAFMHYCNTPTSSIGSPRGLVDAAFQLDEVLSYLTKSEGGMARDAAEKGLRPWSRSKVTSTSDDIKGATWGKSMAMGSMQPPLKDHQEPECEPDVCRQCGVGSFPRRTKLKSQAPAFQPVKSETSMDAVTNAVYLALVSCGRASHVKVDRGLQGTSPTLVSAEVASGSKASSRSYDVIHLAKQAAEAVATQLPSVTLLSARVQKEECGYILRSSIATLPEGAEGKMCWDMYQKGHCPRRHQCRWHHPEDCDISRIKVSIKYVEEVGKASSEQCLGLSSSSQRCTISLGELV